MYRFLILSTLVLSGCSNFSIGAPICDKIASEPNTPQEECQNYDELEAKKAFDKVIDEKKVSDKDIKFDKDEE